MSTRKTTLSQASTFDHSDRSQAADAFGDTRLLNDVHDFVDVLVGVGLLFGQAGTAAGAGEHAGAQQFLVDAAALGGANGRRTRHLPAGAMARTAECLVH